ncbi:MAG: GDP-mannose 4,6-dehydratase, partial [Planctomycetaceae bacterium]|nr:GDP-mannose 4,6-dehydratase [Planctomycetaceae bacterium]
GACRIKEGLQRKLVMGNLDAKRDWGFAGDYVRAMWMMLQRDEPEDYIVATGRTHTIREFLDLAFGMLDLDYRDFVALDPRYTRPSEVGVLRGDPSKARRELGWVPEVDLPGLVRMMVEHDLERARRERFARSRGDAAGGSLVSPDTRLCREIPLPSTLPLHLVSEAAETRPCGGRGTRLPRAHRGQV